MGGAHQQAGIPVVVVVVVVPGILGNLQLTDCSPSFFFSESKCNSCLLDRPTLRVYELTCHLQIFTGQYLTSWLIGFTHQMCRDLAIAYRHLRWMASGHLRPFGWSALTSAPGAVASRSAGLQHPQELLLHFMSPGQSSQKYVIPRT
jgi:hypothetical protein